VTRGNATFEIFFLLALDPFLSRLHPTPLSGLGTSDADLISQLSLTEKDLYVRVISHRTMAVSLHQERPSTPRATAVDHASAPYHPRYDGAPATRRAIVGAWC
jgi:hypothetical protein